MKLTNSNKTQYRMEVLRNPGKGASEAEALALIDQLREVAASCFTTVPSYQALVRSPEALEGKMIALARTQEGRIDGFMSALLIEVDGVGEVLHLGLTCVHPRARGAGLTHKLTKTLLVKHLLHKGLVGKIWLTNVACVLSSLGNVALHFDDIYPSPYGAQTPSAQHLAVARAVSKRHREDIAISQDAIFDETDFVFRGSVEGTSFQKTEDDLRFHHRDARLNKFYCNRMRFHHGDEMIQVGSYSLWTFLSYITGARRRKRAAIIRQLEGAMI